MDPICDATWKGRSVAPLEGVEGTGAIVNLHDDMRCYIVGSGARALIVIYDIFGFAPANTRHNCDLLADAGFLVVMPDLFRGSGRGADGFVRPANDQVPRPQPQPRT